MSGYYTSGAYTGTYGNSNGGYYTTSNTSLYTGSSIFRGAGAHDQFNGTAYGYRSSGSSGSYGSTSYVGGATIYR